MVLEDPEVVGSLMKIWTIVRYALSAVASELPGVRKLHPVLRGY
jgi:hypothetical protein